MSLTDKECNAFRALPLSFNDMVRAIYEAGFVDARTQAWEAVQHQSVFPHSAHRTQQLILGRIEIMQPKQALPDLFGAFEPASARKPKVKAKAKSRKA